MQGSEAGHGEQQACRPPGPGSLTHLSSRELRQGQMAGEELLSEGTSRAGSAHMLLASTFLLQLRSRRTQVTQ